MTSMFQTDEAEFNELIEQLDTIVVHALQQFRDIRGSKARIRRTGPAWSFEIQDEGKYFPYCVRIANKNFHGKEVSPYLLCVRLTRPSLHSIRVEIPGLTVERLTEYLLNF